MSHISVPCSLFFVHLTHWIKELQVRVLQSLNFDYGEINASWNIHSSFDLFFDVFDSVSELENDKGPLCLVFLFLNVLIEASFWFLEENRVVRLQYHLKGVLLFFVFQTILYIFGVDCVDFLLPVVRDLWFLITCLNDYLSLSIDKHVRVSLCSTEHALQFARHDWCHSRVIEVEPIFH